MLYSILSWQNTEWQRREWKYNRWNEKVWCFSFFLFFFFYPSIKYFYTFPTPSDKIGWSGYQWCIHLNVDPSLKIILTSKHRPRVMIIEMCLLPIMQKWVGGRYYIDKLLDWFFIWYNLTTKTCYFVLNITGIFKLSSNGQAE